ncbi:MAG: glycosyltransferase [Candidatus Bathyarchaeota archaeon]|nr:glycosyltransferase [Candidatus Bathyarchaeota archaeon]
MILEGFHGLVGNAVNERRIATSLASHKRVEHVSVIAISTIQSIMQPREPVNTEKMDTITLPRIPAPCPFFYMLQLVIYGFLLSSIAVFLKLTRSFDVIYIRGTWLAFGFVTLRKILGPVAVKIASISSDHLYAGKKSLFKRIATNMGWSLEKYLIKNADTIFSIPGFVNVIAKIRGNDNHIVVLPQPVSFELFSRPTPISSLPKKEYVVGYVGNLSPVHSVDVVVEAMSLVQKVVSNSQLLIVGTGDLRDEARVSKLMKRLNVKGSLILRVPEKEMPAIYNSLDLLLIPRSKLLNNVVPMKFVEAVVANVPIVATKTDAITDLLSGTGVEEYMVVDENEPQSWASKIQRLLVDDDLRFKIVKTVSEHLNVYVVSHKPEVVAEQMLSSINKRAFE